MVATILVPTFDHGPLLERAVRSALRQTVAEVEVFIVGDGVPDTTRAIADRLMREDPRVRFFDHPKSPRTGEPHRHLALQEARGRIVCYLSDDDLYLPDHVATMAELLADADFAHSLPVYIGPDETPGVLTTDASLESFRAEYRAEIFLTCAAHTLAFYHGLPHGWRTTPEGVYTDRYMWQQIFDAGARAVSSRRITTLVFPSPDRRDWTLDERGAELDRWSDRLADPALRGALAEDLVATLTRERAAEVDRRNGPLRRRVGQSWQAVRTVLAEVPGARPLVRSARRLGGGLRGR